MNIQDELVMKLIHYFITEQNYQPIVLYGAKNEIWLENLNNEHEVVRIVSNYIHNDEQLNFDLYKTEQITKKIKRKTLSLKIKILSIFINLGENVSIDNKNYTNIDIVGIKNIKDLKKYPLVINEFPTITNKTNFKEKGNDLLMKITKDLNEKTEKEAYKNNDVFKMKLPVITYILILINTCFYIFTSLYSNSFIQMDANVLAYFGGVLKDEIVTGQYYRLFTGIFMHASIIHFLFNNYALYVIGPQIESFYGKVKYLIIYILSGLIGNLLSILFLPSNTVAVGASGAIFGLLGSLLYFGYHYRIYLSSVLKSQIIPLIILNLMIGFMVEGIDNTAHIGGLIGGILASIWLGVKNKSTKFEKTNGFIMLVIFIAFLGYVAFIK